jgi:hypothetical protein
MAHESLYDRYLQKEVFSLPKLGKTGSVSRAKSKGMRTGYDGFNRRSMKGRKTVGAEKRKEWLGKSMGRVRTVNRQKDQKMYPLSLFKKIMGVD